MTTALHQTPTLPTRFRPDQADALRRLADARAHLLEATALLNGARDDLHWAFRHARQVGLTDEELTRVVIE